MKTWNKYLVLSLLVLLCYASVSAQSLHPKLAAIHKEFYGQWPKTITFVQKTDMYRADTVFRTQTWYEAGIFPNFFRIDLGDPKEGNAMIYRGDSTYIFRKSKLLRAVVDPNILVYLLGGMYFETADQVAQHLKKEGFDLSQNYKTKWNNREVEVFGTAQPDSTKSQLWYDTKNHYLVRMIQQNEKSRLECHFENHQKVGKVWHEGNVKIFVNNKLVQTEAYSNFKIDVALKAEFFDPNNFGSWHWLN